MRSIRRLIYQLKEIYFIGQVKIENKINKNFIKLFDDQSKKRKEKNFLHYLNENKPVSILKGSKWINKGNLDLFRFSNSIFSDGEIKVFNNHKGNKGIIIYLPGFHATELNVIFDVRHPEYLGDFIKDNNLTLITWEWPLQGKRINSSLFQNINSVYSAEREYTKILTLFGSCLFLEYINELKFILKAIEIKFPKKEIITIGYSMGGFFSYFVPIINPNFSQIISIGSFNSFKNLLKSKKTKVHSQYFYPYNSAKYFDIDNIIYYLCKDIKKKVTIIFGDKDFNCSLGLKKSFEKRIKKFKNLKFKILTNHGHEFSKNILYIIKNEI